jgi:hypothetical protein
MSEKIQVLFSSEEFEISSTPILLPIALKRYGLSEVVNHLLGLEEEPIPFDFIIDKRFLRGSLEEYLNANQISTVWRDRVFIHSRKIFLKFILFNFLCRPNYLLLLNMTIGYLVFPFRARKHCLQPVHTMATFDYGMTMQKFYVPYLWVLPQD